MEFQSGFPRVDPTLSQGSQVYRYQELQDELESSAMNRYPSNQSNNTQSTGNSDWTGTASGSYTNSVWDGDDCMQDVKLENTMPDDAYANFGGQFHNVPARLTEPANSYQEMCVEDYQIPSGQRLPSGRPAVILSAIASYYPETLNDRTLALENFDSLYMNYEAQDTRPMSRSLSRPSSSYAPYTNSDSQMAYSSDPLGAKHTPTTLEWPDKANHVAKYRLILPKENWYLEILHDSLISYTTPSKVYLDIPKSTQKGFVQCPWPGECPRGNKAFTRPADLVRHMQKIHGPPEGRKVFCCSYKPCINDRHLEKNAFSRKDHYRDHLRDYHQEDIGAAKVQKDAKSNKHAREELQKKWLASRKISAAHWRCARCLSKKWVSKHGWSCEECKLPCEQDRIEARKRLPYKKESQTSIRSDVYNGSLSGPQQYTFGPDCPAGCDEGWFINSSDDDKPWDPCQCCNSRQSQVGTNAFRP